MGDVTDPTQATRIMEEEILHWLKFACLTRFGSEIFSEVRIHRDFMTDMFVMQARADLLSKKLPNRSYKATGQFSTDVPSSTWQMFKRTHCYSWWLKKFVQRYPVQVRAEYRYGTVTMDLTDVVVYPWQTMVPKDKNLGLPVRVITPGQQLWRWSETEEEN